MNAAQRRIQRRKDWREGPSTCGLQGYSGTTSYPDLMCQDGYMRDMDADGYDPSTWAQPCQVCNHHKHTEWLKELAEEAEEDA